MRPIRTRITMAFAGAFAASLLVFAIVLLIARRDAAMQEIVARAQFEVDQTVSLIDASRSMAMEPIAVEADSLVSSGVSGALGRFLAVVDDIVLVLDGAGDPLYVSTAVAELDPLGQEWLLKAARTMQSPGRTMRLPLASGEVVLAMRDVTSASATRIRRVVVGVPTTSAALVPQQLLWPMLLLAPVLVLCSVGWAWLIAGRAFEPLDRMVDQVRAITDGRSLHRRVAIGGAGTEMQRLAMTLNEMIERLETSFGALRRFTADASHELKTPLAVLRADVERAMSPTTKRGERAVALEEALEQVTRMAELVNSLLTLARADEGRLEVVQDLIRADDLAREVVETARLLGEEAGVQIETGGIDSALVRGDLMRLRQLFLNLVTNAIKYTRRGGRVTIGMARVGEQVHFSVRDTGIGIAAADLPYVFDRFWRSDRARSRASERGGFGLGLAISQWIAHAHGGSLTVQSRLGRGSTFTALLPLADSDGDGSAEVGAGASGLVESRVVTVANGLLTLP